MANFYSEDIVSDVCAANDIVDIVSGYVRLKRSGSNFMGCCPFHKEKTPSFHISADKQLYHCFGCGAGGGVIQFIMNIEGLDFPDALRFLADRAGITLPENTNVTSGATQKKQTIYDMNRDAARFFRECLLGKDGEEARSYLTKRGLSGKTIAAFGLGFAPSGWDGLLKHLLSKGYKRDLIVEAGLCIKNEKGHVYDRFRGRVMYPIIDVRHNIIGFGGRIMNGDGAKYINSPESIVYDKGKNLFALNLAKKSKRGYYILVEGYMDVISLHQSGIDAAVAGCGTALTEAQARLISKSPVYLCYDSDEAGQKACERAAEIFSKFDTRLRVIEMGSAKDADEFINKYGVNKFEELIKKAKTVTEHRIDTLLSGADLSDAAQKIEVVRKASVIFSSIPNAVEREVYIKQLSIKSGVSVDSINAEIRKINGKNVRKEVSTELRRAVNGEIQNRGTQVASSRRIRAEAGFLSMLLRSRKVYEKYFSVFSEESFALETHKEIFKNICTYYKEGGASTCDSYLMSKMQGQEKELSKVIMLGENVSNCALAADDYAEALSGEIFNDKLEKAQKEGNVALISELLKEKKQKGGKYNG